MKCSNCGAVLPEGAVFCSSCGRPLEQKTAPDKKPVVRFAILITMLVCLALVLVSGWKMHTTNVSKMDVVTWGMDTFFGFDLEQELETLDDTRRELRADLRENGHRKAPEQYEAQEQAIDQFRDLQKAHTVSELLDFVDYLGQENAAIWVDTAALAVMQRAAVAAQIALAVLYLLPLVFGLLAGIRKSSALTVTAAVLTLLVQVLFSAGLGLILGSLLVYGLQLALCLSLQPHGPKKT